MDKELDLLEELRQKAIELVEAREKCEDDSDDENDNDDEVVDGAEVEDDEDDNEKDTKPEGKKKKEEIEEISGATLGSYVQKARQDAKKRVEHDKALDGHPKVAALKQKVSDLYADRRYKKSGELVNRAKINKTSDAIEAEKKKLDSNYPKSIQTHKRHAGVRSAIEKLQHGKMTEETTESVDFSSIFAGEDLTEEFKLKVTTMFEAVVAQKVSAVEATLVEAMEAIQEEMAQEALTEAAELEEGLIERVDGYLDYMVEQWMEKNELALESGIKSDLFESFMSGMQNLFTEHMINVPEDKVEILEQQAEVIDELEGKFDELLSENVSLKQTLKSIAKQNQIVEATEGLSDVEAERFMDLAEELSYDNEEVFGKKLVLIREQFFGSTKESNELSESVVSSEPLLESVEEGRKQPMSQIDKLAAQISRSKI